MAYKRIPTIFIKDAEIIYRNFSGREQQFNERGKRNFCVFIDDEDVAQQLIDDNWNVRIKPPYDETDKPRYYIKVNVNFKTENPPRILMIKGNTEVELDEETVGRLDTADIEYIELEISPHDYNKKYGKEPAYSGYVKEMHVTIAESKFSRHAVKEAPEEEPW